MSDEEDGAVGIEGAEPCAECDGREYDGAANRLRCSECYSAGYSEGHADAYRNLADARDALERREARGCPEWLAELGREIHHQDNRGTDAPVFDVQRRVYDQVDERCEPSLWMVFDRQACESEGPFEDRPEETPTRIVYGVAERWEHVASYFTERAAQQYVGHRGHGGEMRVWASSLYRNAELRRIRRWLLQLAVDAPGHRGAELEELRARAADIEAQCARANRELRSAQRENQRLQEELRAVQNRGDS